MYIEHIVLNNFRMLANFKYEFDRNFNLIYGKNAQGKTSLIEAVYFLASGKSFRTRKIVEQIKQNEKRSIVFGKLENTTLAVELSKDKRNFFLDRNKVKYSEYLGNMLVVSFSPEDMELIIGAPDIRRRFFNYEISQTDRSYLNVLINFQKVLKIRNKLLKEGKINTEVFNLYNKKYIELSVDLSIKRNEYIRKLSSLIGVKYSEIFESPKNSEIKYECFLGNIEGKTKEELIANFTEYLRKRSEKEKIFGFSINGPQKDDFVFYIDSQIVKAYASQGEKKSILFALKLSQNEYIIEKTGHTPIFLLDDIAAYFDEFRKYRVIEYFKEKKIQCFFTSTEKLDIQAKEIYVENGEVRYDEAKS